MNLKDNLVVSLLPSQLRKISTELINSLDRLNNRNPLALLASCSPVIKSIKGNEYLYAQGRLASGKQRQIFVCPRNKGRMLEEKLIRARQDNSADLEYAGMANKALRAMGMPALPPPQWQVLSALSEAGIFRGGGVLIGDAGYLCNVSLLRGRLSTTSIAELRRRMDEEGISIAFSHRVQFPTSPLERLLEGYSPFNEFNPFVTGKHEVATESGCMVKFMRSLIREDSASEGETWQQMTPEQRVLLDYLIRDPLLAVVLGRRPLLVKVPQPARHIVYRLIVSQFPGRDRGEVERDLQQAYVLTRLIKEENPSDLGGAKNTAQSRRPEWGAMIEAGSSMMTDLFGNV